VAGGLPSKAGLSAIPTASGGRRDPSSNTHAGPCAGVWCGGSEGRQRLPAFVWGSCRGIRVQSRFPPQQWGSASCVNLMIGTAGVVYTSVLGVKSYDYGKIN